MSFRFFSVVVFVRCGKSCLYLLVRSEPPPHVSLAPIIKRFLQCFARWTPSPPAAPPVVRAKEARNAPFCPAIPILARVYWQKRSFPRAACFTDNNLCFPRPPPGSTSFLPGSISALRKTWLFSPRFALLSRADSLIDCDRLDADFALVSPGIPLRTILNFGLAHYEFFKSPALARITLSLSMKSHFPFPTLLKFPRRNRYFGSSLRAVYPTS